MRPVSSRGLSIRRETPSQSRGTRALKQTDRQTDKEEQMGVAEKRRAKKKLAKARRQREEKKNNEGETEEKRKEGKASTTKKSVRSTVEVEYVAAPLDTLDGDVPEEMREVFEAFAGRPANGEKVLDDRTQIAAEEEKKKKKKKKKKNAKNAKENEEEFSSSSSSSSDEDDEDDSGDEKANDGLTRKQRKEMKRLQIADLKRVCEKPEVVEIWDTTASDPEFLVYIKASRNAVPVPRHWSQKRAFLAGKRGMEKPPFKLPTFIEATGIAKLRDSYAEREEQKSLKSKVKDTKTAKLGRIDIDYQVMHDAFFKFQTKPKMTKMGDLYFEGKEYEISLGDRKPGNLSDELKAALGIDGNNGPPPWLINMQRYGPPPAYPKLPIPGLSAPIPEGAQFGYHPGGWGKPPVDEYGRALYGDVFGINATKQTARTKYDEPIMKGEHFFGELGSDDEESESEEESEDEEEEEEEQEEEEEEEVVEEEEQVAVEDGDEGKDGDEPESIDLRKRSSKTATTTGEDEPKELYKVIGEKEVKIGSALMGSERIYDVSGAASSKKTIGSGVDVAIAPEDLENLDEEGLRKAFEKQKEKDVQARRGEDFSSMVKDHARQQKRKADAKREDAKSSKKFKF